MQTIASGSLGTQASKDVIRRQGVEQPARQTVNPLARFGQTCWLDDLTRTLIRSGELQRRVSEEGLTGVTTNPATLRAAFETSGDYDREIRALAARPLNSIYETLIVADVRDACDLLRCVYDRTGGRDGFVSLEVSPYLARNTQGCIADARRLWEAVARPNLLIKIPATFEGIAAAETLLSRGINVDITLLFSVERYERAALAYMGALERRRAGKAPLSHIASVASFFLSRIDARVDELLLQRINTGRPEARRLLGKCAIANARLAYRRFRQLTSSGRWHFVEDAGARPQRLLWASTATKHPACEDLTYMEPLIGLQADATLPQQAIAGFAEPAFASLELELDEASEIMRGLRSIGIDVAQVTRRLLDEGIERSIESFNGVLQSIAMRAATGTSQ